MKESPAGLLLAQNRKQIFFHARSLWEHDIVIFITSFSVSTTINKRYMNSIPWKSEPQFPPKEMVVWRNKCMNISCRSGLLNWLWNGFLNDTASSGFCEKMQERAVQLKITYNLNTHPRVKGLQLCCNLAVNAAALCQVPHSCPSAFPRF